MEAGCPNPAAFQIEYADGTRATVLMLNGYVRGWAYAGRVDGTVQGTRAVTGGDPHPHFSYLSRNIQTFFLSEEAPYPVERTLLVTGALDALMDSCYRDHERVETPHLGISYTSYSEMPIRPTGPRPSGASLVPIVPGRG
jgi:hypothetical protein